MLCCLNSKYLRFVSLQGAFRYAGIDVRLNLVVSLYNKSIKIEF